MYYIDIGSFISKIIEPAMLPFCLAECKRLTTCDRDKKSTFRCFITVNVEEMRHRIDQTLILPDSSLLPLACDKSIEDIFTGITDEEPAEYGEYFEMIIELCEGKIGKLTESAMDAYQRGREAANPRKIVNVDLDLEATQVYLDNKAGKTRRIEGEAFRGTGSINRNAISVSPVKEKKFFFREKIQ